MSTRHEDNDGSDIFWPGYVDATTNLILNLLFLLTILMVAVFMFALELGRSSPLEPVPQVAVTDQNAIEPNMAAAGSLAVVATATTELTEAIATATSQLSGAVESAESAESAVAGAALEATGAAMSPAPEATADFEQAVSVAVHDFSLSVAAAMDASAQENTALSQEVERLIKLLSELTAQQEAAAGVTETVDATLAFALPQNGLDKSLTSDFEVVIRFLPEAIEFSPEERNQLLDSLQPFSDGGKASIYVEVPAGFSEAKRMGFYRAMAVRNLLIEMDLPQENIEVKVVEGNSKAKASIVRVRPN